MKNKLWLWIVILALLPLAASAQWTQHDIYNNFSGAYGVETGDLDGDGDMDVAACADGTSDLVYWFENTGGGWTEHQIATGFGGKDCIVEDIDSDGDLDIAACAYTPGYVTWWENDGTGVFTRHDLSFTFNGAYAIDAGDIDGDGDIDIASVAWAAGDVAWWENTGGGFLMHTVDDAYSSPHGVSLGDLDGDGHMDICASSGSVDNVVWYHNNNDGTWTQFEIATGDYCSAVQVSDIDDDGDLDVSAAIYSTDTMIALMNDGAGTFTEMSLSTTFDGAWNVTACDIGTDGDMDVVGSSRFEGIRYWEYEGGEFTETVLIADFGDVRSVYGVDMDGDNDQDIIAVSEDFGAIAWWEQPGQGTPDLIELNVYPQNPPIVIAPGESFFFDVEIISHLQGNAQGKVWTEAELPNSQVFGPIQQVNLTFTPNTNIYVVGVEQEIPVLAPTGLYEWRVNIGPNVQNPIFTDSFTFTVELPAGYVADGPSDWYGNPWTEAMFAETGKELAVELPSGFQVSDVYPNPFNSSARVSVTLPETQRLTARVFDSLGRQVAELANGVRSAGTHELSFEPSNLASGVYFLRVNAGGEQVLRKLVYMK